MIDPKSSETSGYHLFLKPEGELANTFQECIAKLAQENGGPVFDPHVTLLAAIPEEDEEKVISIATMLASELHPFTAVLGNIGMEDTFFRALYVRAESSDDLSDAHAKALAAFNMQEGSPYMPHLSLFYGNLPVEAKEKMAVEIALPENREFIIDKIYVYKTPGPATAWEQVVVLALQ